MYLALLWRKCQVKLWSNFGMHLRALIAQGSRLLSSPSKEHITGPLGMESSFYLTPELKRRLVNLTFRDSDGGLHLWANQVKIIEQDPSKGGPVYATISCASWVLLTASCESVRLHLGGVGMYSSMRDYLKILRHLMQINGKLSIAYPLRIRPVDSSLPKLVDLLLTLS